MSQRRRLTLACIAAVLTIGAIGAQAQTLKVLFDFTGGQDGGTPYAGLTMDKAGNLYGTTSAGGANNSGTVFRLSNKGAGWVFMPLYSFQGGADGAYPEARVIVGPDGTLYGTTYAGGQAGCLGNEGCGTIFNLRPPPRACLTALCSWTKTMIYEFTGGSDGATPGTADLIFDRAGNIYGTTQYGGYAGISCPLGSLGCGVVFELTPKGSSWTQTVLYSFTGGNDGYDPHGGVIFDSGGNLYGAAYYGGSSNQGTLYELSPSGSSWTENTIFTFQGCCGEWPVGSLLFDGTGNLWGVTDFNGDDGGTIYELAYSNNNWTRVSQVGLTHEYPLAGFAMGAAGHLYTTASGDAAKGTYGAVLDNLGEEVYDFTGGSDGWDPSCSVIFDASGNLYGTTSRGGKYDYGVVWELTR